MPASIFRTVLQVLLLLSLAGCYSAPIIREDAALKEDEKTLGFILAGASRKWTETDRRDTPLLQLLYREANGNRFEMKTVTFQNDTDVVLQKLPAGEYVLYNSFFGFKHMLLPEVQFRVVPGQITYLGDFNITVKYPKIGLLTNRSLTVLDNRDATTEKLRRHYPQIASSYEVRSQVTAFAKKD